MSSTLDHAPVYHPILTTKPHLRAFLDLHPQRMPRAARDNPRSAWEMLSSSPPRSTWLHKVLPARHHDPDVRTLGPLIAGLCKT